MEKVADISTSLAADVSDGWLQQPDPPEERVDLMIDPNSKRWTKVHRYFTKVLESDMAIEDVIRRSFTHHQYRMMAPTERTDVKEMQAANTKRYNALLAGRFKCIEDSLATRLTAMYFGLPAAPVDNPLEEIAMMLGLDEKEVPRYNFRPPLHFLTAHDRRNWGKETLKSEEATIDALPLPRAMEPTLSLRGGGDDDDLIGWTDDYTPEYETTALFTDGWTYIHGLYGRLPFVPRKWRSFSKVLRQLLQVKDYEYRDFSLLWHDRKLGKPKVFHDQLPLTKESPAMAFLDEHFADSTKSHKDCCALFIDNIHTDINKGPQHWEPIDGQLQSDTIKIGRSLGNAPNGPEDEVISYAYMAFPKTKIDTFKIGKYGSNQYNAHFCKTLNVLFGAPESSAHHHALFRLVDKKKTKTNWTVPIVYGAMGLPQWAWELLHPVNNPGANWMVECCWLDPGLEAILLSNYYPKPNPYLITRKLRNGAERFNQAYRQICEMTTEAFDASVCRKINSVFLIEGHKPKTAGELVIDGFQVRPRRDLKSWKLGIPGTPNEDTPRDLGKKLGESPNFYKTVHVNWRPGHCRLFPGWYSGGDFSVEMPRLSSTVVEFLEAMGELFKLVGPPNLNSTGPEDSCFLLTEAPSFDGLQVQDMDSPSYYIGVGATDDDWHDIRKSITSPLVTVSIVKKPKNTSWSTSISKHNLWGLRLDEEALRQNEMNGGGFRRDALQLYDLNGESVDILDGYPADPVPLEPIDPNNNVSVTTNGKPWTPTSRRRPDAFVPPRLLKIRSKSVGGAEGLHLPSTLVIGGASTPDGEPESDIGILATSRPKFRGFPPPPSEDEDDGDLVGGLAEDDHRRYSMYGDLFSDSGEEDGGGSRNKDADGDEAMEDTSLPSVPQADVTGGGEGNDDDEDETPKLFGLPKIPEEREPEDDPEDRPEQTVPPPSVTTTKPFFQASNTVEADDRAHTWATQPSIFTNEDQRAWPADAEIGLPITAAPAEKIHRLSGNVPMYSKAILTPTEQAELQRGFGDLRNILLKRTNMCPFQGCSFTWRLDQNEELNIHVFTAHAKRKCPFCDDALFGWWDKNQQIKHLGDKHPDEVKKMQGHGIQKGNISLPVTVNAPANPIGEAFAEEIRSWGPQYKLKAPPRLLTYPLLAWYDNFGTTAVKDPPKKCPIPSCSVPHLEHLSSHGVWTHFKNYHTDLEMDACPFCNLSFYSYGDKDKDGVRTIIPHSIDECIMHLDCHVYQLWDLLEPVVGQPPKVNMPSQGNKDFQTISAEKLESMRAEVVAKTVAATLARTGADTQSVANQSAPPQVSHGHVTDASKILMKCAYFEKCGAYVGSMTEKQYRRHVRVNHPKEISTLSSSSEDETDGDDQASTDDGSEDRGDDKPNDSDDRRDGAGKTAALKFRRLKPTPKPAQVSTPSKPKEKAVPSKPPSPPDPDEMDISTDDNIVGTESSRSEEPAVVISEKTPTTKITTPRTPPPDGDSGTNEESGSSVSRGRRSVKVPKSKRKAPAKRAEPDVDEDNTEDNGEKEIDDFGKDGEADGSGSKSSNTEGRGRSAKKAGKRRPRGDDDGDYEDEGDQDDDDFEMAGNKGRRYRRRAPSPDWIKVLGPEDPDFDPEDKMYCSKCLRKAPLRRAKSPNRSPIGRAGEIEAHTDKTKCCRIRNGLGSSERLPNRSGWIPANKLPGTLTSLKEDFLNRYPSYMRTMYPTSSRDHHASVWRSDPNNPENDAWFDVPWPPYEGLPPFPGDWIAPGLPWDDTPEGRQRRAMYIGNRVVDENYQYQSETDSDDDLKPDVNDIPDFQADLNPLKRPAEDKEETSDEPAPKKAKKSKTAATKTPKATGTKKTPAPKKAAAPSKTPAKTRSKAPSKAASKAPSKTPSKAASKTPSKAPSKTPSKAPSKSPSKAPSKASSKGPSKTPSRASSRKTTPSKTPSTPSTRPPSEAGDE
ncbi:hypothetical protein ACHAP4_002730 [Fusarium culmorum]